MFEIKRDGQQLVFIEMKTKQKFGDGTRIIFSIDLEFEALQRGRQEYIPLSTIDGFKFDDNDGGIVCVLGESEMLLYTCPECDKGIMTEAVETLNNFCGINKNWS